MRTMFPTLRNWNIFMTIIQLAMGIFLTISYHNEDLLDFKEMFYRFGIDKKGTSNAEEYKVEWIKRDSSSIPYAQEAIAFFYVTAFFHCLYVLMGEKYEDMIVCENNWLRWLEYGITATLMIRIIAIQAGIRDENTLTSISLNTVGVMLCGQIVETTLSHSVITEKDKNVIFVASLIGWIIMVTNFVIIVRQYINLENDVDNLNCDDVSIPSFVLWIIITQLIFYSTFGFLQIWHIWCRLYKKDYEYRNTELYYLVDSLLSKVTLGGILGYSVLNAKKGVYGKFVC